MNAACIPTLLARVPHELPIKCFRQPVPAWPRRCSMPDASRAI